VPTFSFVLHLVLVPFLVLVLVLAWLPMTAFYPNYDWAADLYLVCSQRSIYQYGSASKSNISNDFLPVGKMLRSDESSYLGETYWSSKLVI